MNCSNLEAACPPQSNFGPVNSTKSARKYNTAFEIQLAKGDLAVHVIQNRFTVKVILLLC